MTALTVSIATGNDDGNVAPGFLLQTGIGNRNYVGNYAGYDLSSFYRFTNVTIPQAATINSAYLEVKLFSYNGSTSATIYGHKTANSSQPTSDTDFYSRTKTSASVSWSLGTPGANVTIQTPSLVSVIQEIVNQGAWASGNALTLLIDSVPSAVNAQLDCFETSGGLIPSLVLDYTAAAPGGKGNVLRSAVFGGLALKGRALR